MNEFLLRLGALIGLGTSTLLLAEYLAPSHGLCTPGGGCDAVRQSAYASLLGIPTPVYGVGFFAALLLLSVVPRAWASSVRAGLAVLGAAGGVGFIAVQAVVVKAACAYCLVVDVAAIAVGVLAVAVRRAPTNAGGAGQRLGTLATFGGAAAAVAVAGIVHLTTADSETATLSNADSGSANPGRKNPAALSTAADAALPPIIAAYQQPGKVTIVEFVDFQCPMCRALHEQISQVLAEYGDRIAVIYKHVPLPQHRQAQHAARAACCADEEGLGSAMADALLRAPDLSPASCERIAKNLGVDVTRYRQCITAERTDERIAGDKRDAQALAVRGLPTLWIGDQRVVGLRNADVLRGYVERALATAAEQSREQDAIR